VTERGEKFKLVALQHESCAPVVATRQHITVNGGREKWRKTVGCWTLLIHDERKICTPHILPNMVCGCPWTWRRNVGAPLFTDIINFQTVHWYAIIRRFLGHLTEADLQRMLTQDGTRSQSMREILDQTIISVWVSNSFERTAVHAHQLCCHWRFSMASRTIHALQMNWKLHPRAHCQHGTTVLRSFGKAQ
jgi:hypothetical protein